MITGEYISITLSYYLVTLVIGLVGFLITMRLFPKLHDQGYAISRAVGLLIVSYISWLFAYFQAIPYTTTTLWVITIVLLFFLVTRKRQNLSKKTLKTIILEEFIFIFVFFVFVFYRSFANEYTEGEAYMNYGINNILFRGQY